MSTYFKFSKKIPFDYPNRLQRQAVLYRINRNIPRNNDQIYGQVLNVLKLWRFRIKDLYTDEQITSANAAYYANCRPTFVYTTPKTRCCRIRWLCPFCFARNMIRVWDSLAALLLGEPNKQQKGKVRGRQLLLDDIEDNSLLSDYDLITCQKKFNIGTVSETAVPIYPSVVDNPEDWIYYNLRRNSNSYKNIYKQATSTAGLFRHTTLSIENDNYHVINRELWLVKKDTPFHYDHIPSCKRYTTVNKKELLKICTWFCIYPGSLLTEESYDKFLPVWKVYNSKITSPKNELAFLGSNMRKVNSMSRYGLFRQSRQY